MTRVSPTLLRFLVVGGIAFIVNQALLALLYEVVLADLREPYEEASLLVASVTALEASILVRFPLHDRWTFRGRCRQPLASRFLQFHVSSFGSPLICLAAVNLLTPVFGVSYLIANSAGIMTGLAWNWFWSNRVVWGETQDHASPLHHSPTTT